MFVRSNEKNYLFLCLCLFVDYQKKMRNSKEKKSIMLEFSIYKELKLGKLKYCVAWNSSLPSSSSMWHFFNQKIHVNTSIFYETQVFKTRFTQQIRVSKKVVYCYLFCKQWYVTNNFREK